MNFRECYDKYFDIVTEGGVKQSGKPSAARDAALLPLSCVPLLAYDGSGYSYPVCVDNGVLYLVGAPSGWGLADLIAREGGYPHGIALDLGQNWFCTNFQEVLDAVVAMGVVPAEVKSSRFGCNVCLYAGCECVGGSLYSANSAHDGSPSCGHYAYYD